MKIYEILDEETRLSVGILLYYEKEKSCVIELEDDLDEWSAPFLFTAFVKKGIYTIPREFSFLWVRERVIPSGRQNIQSILKTHKLKEYDEIKFLELSRGKCSQDSLYIRKTDTLPDYVQSRQKTNLREAAILPDNRLLAFFQNGETKVLSQEQLQSIPEMDKVLGNELLKSSGMIRADGYCFSFNNSIDIPAKILYETGQTIPLTLDDIKVLVQNYTYDTSQACTVLECSRQNISHFVKANKLQPIKNNVNGNLFLKGDVDRMRRE
ncbi:MAG: hypothetical protein K5744_07275 [Eubacterium sp.]|nr:hypothetical protein [Eubacterium sp.]